MIRRWIGFEVNGAAAEISDCGLHIYDCARLDRAAWERFKVDVDTLFDRYAQYFEDAPAAHEVRPILQKDPPTPSPDLRWIIKTDHDDYLTSAGLHRHNRAGAIVFTTQEAAELARSEYLFDRKEPLAVNLFVESCYG